MSTSHVLRTIKISRDAKTDYLGPCPQGVHNPVSRIGMKRIMVWSRWNGVCTVFTHSTRAEATGQESKASLISDISGALGLNTVFSRNKGDGAPGRGNTCHNKKAGNEWCTRVCVHENMKVCKLPVLSILLQCAVWGTFEDDIEELGGAPWGLTPWSMEYLS